MERKNEEGFNILEESFFILFEHGDELFALYLLNNLPNISKYLYQKNNEGWFPLFRVLHLFQREIYESDRGTRNKGIAQKLLDALFKIDYDFMMPSSTAYYKTEYLCTFEMLLTVPVDVEFFRQIIEFIWNSS